jgi:hypothetical protein
MNGFYVSSVRPLGSNDREWVSYMLSLAILAPCPMSTRGSFPGGKAARV